MTSLHVLIAILLQADLAPAPKSTPVDASHETAPHHWHAPSTPIAGGHVFPHFAVIADGTESRSEAGIGALIPWADRL